MYFKCCIPNCKSTRRAVKLHKFPRQEFARNKWLKIINCSNLKKLDPCELQKLLVCHKHFEQRFYTSKSGVLQTAYPSLFSAEEIASGIPSMLYDDKDLEPEYHPYSKQKHYDHLYCKKQFQLGHQTPLVATTTTISGSTSKVTFQNDGNISDMSEAIEYGECCCCLEEGNHRDLTQQYYWNELPEIYEVLLKDTFDFVLKYPETTKLICNICIEKLRQAKNFRSMVESSQWILSDRVNWQTESVNEDPLELELNIKSNKYESENQMEEADNDEHYSDYTTGELNYDLDMKEENIDSPTSSSDKMKPLEVLLIRCPIIEQLVSYDSNCQYEQLAAPLRPTENLSHVNKHTEEKRDLTIEETFACDKCQYKAMHRKHLKRHVRIHREKRYSCHVCEYKCLQKQQLKVHLYTHTGERPFSCDLCQYKTTQKKYIKRHLESHNKEKQFPCDICQYTATQKKYLIRHILQNHSGVKRFSCQYCDFKTSRTDGLQFHLLSHTGEKPFSCHHCTYKSSRKDHLKIHLRVHTGEKPYSCQVCQFKTAYKGVITKHYLRNHSNNN